MEKLIFKDTSVTVEKGELISFVMDEHEFIHQKGSPGWRNSDTEMFPIIGPTNEADFKVQTPSGMAVQDQHGLLRELSYELISSETTMVSYQKKYKANTEISNSKFPEKSSASKLYWPYVFLFEKSFSLSEFGLEISFKIEGEKGMPYMLGYHPAFKLYSENPIIQANGKTISLKDVLAVGSRALAVEDCKNILLKDKKTLSITTEGFGNFMLWTEVPNMICIEPITFYPYAVNAMDLHKGFDILNDEPKLFKVYVTPE